MAVRKTGTRKTARKPPAKTASKSRVTRAPTSAAFWTFLIIVIIIAVFTLVPVIKKNLKLTPQTAETGRQKEQPEITAQPEPPPAPQPSKPRPEQSPAVPAKPPALSPEQKTPEKKEQEKKPEPDKKAEPAPVSKPPVQTPSQPSKPADTHDRSIYFIGANNNLVEVNRTFKVSETTLRNSINALLDGPAPDEIMRGIDSFIPEGSRLLNASVEGSTAKLSFNQEFRYNPRGREGCALQIKQIVWTATEFSNIQNVQFLIEGERVDFLSEGVRISDPIGR